MTHDSPQVRGLADLPGDRSAARSRPRRPARLPHHAAYLHVPDADALAAEWAHVERTGAPVDTDDWLREGWHIDPDGTLLRFGSPLPSVR
jgi:hypothetical protein